MFVLCKLERTDEKSFVCFFFYIALIVCDIVCNLERTDEKIGDLFVCLMIVVRLFVLGKLERTDEKAGGPWEVNGDWLFHRTIGRSNIM